jgi:hypothetical protein
MSTYRSLIALPLWILAGLLGLNLMVAVQPGAEAGSPEGPTLHGEETGTSKSWSKGGAHSTGVFIGASAQRSPGNPPF